jgi:hypothetical protein
MDRKTLWLLNDRTIESKAIEVNGTVCVAFCAPLCSLGLERGCLRVRSIFGFTTRGGTFDLCLICLTLMSVCIIICGVAWRHLFRLRSKKLLPLTPLQSVVGCACYNNYLPNYEGLVPTPHDCLLGILICSQNIRAEIDFEQIRTAQTNCFGGTYYCY